MKKALKRLLTLTLAICCLMTPIALAAGAEQIQPRLNNTVSTFMNMSITSTGMLSIGYDYSGFPGVTTHAVIRTRVEKKVLFLWTDVDLGVPDDVWVDTVYQSDYTGGRSFQLSKSGTYRVTVEYTIYGSGGAADVLEHQATDSY